MRVLLLACLGSLSLSGAIPLDRTQPASTGTISIPRESVKAFCGTGLAGGTGAVHWTHEYALLFTASRLYQFTRAFASCEHFLLDGEPVEVIQVQGSSSLNVSAVRYVRCSITSGTDDKRRQSETDWDFQMVAFTMTAVVVLQKSTSLNTWSSYFSPGSLPDPSIINVDQINDTCVVAGDEVVLFVCSGYVIGFSSGFLSDWYYVKIPFQDGDVLVGSASLSHIPKTTFGDLKDSVDHSVSVLFSRTVSNSGQLRHEAFLVTRSSTDWTGKVTVTPSYYLSPLRDVNLFGDYSSENSTVRVIWAQAVLGTRQSATHIRASTSNGWFNSLTKTDQSVLILEQFEHDEDWLSSLEIGPAKFPYLTFTPMILKAYASFTRSAAQMRLYSHSADVPLAFIPQRVAPIVSSANHYPMDEIFQQSHAAVHMFLELPANNTMLMQCVGFKFKSSLRHASYTTVRCKSKFDPPPECISLSCQGNSCCSQDSTSRYMQCSPLCLNGFQCHRNRNGPNTCSSIE